MPCDATRCESVWDDDGVMIMIMIFVLISSVMGDAMRSLSTEAKAKAAVIVIEF